MFLAFKNFHCSKIPFYKYDHLRQVMHSLYLIFHPWHNFKIYSKNIWGKNKLISKQYLEKSVKYLGKAFELMKGLWVELNENDQESLRSTYLLSSGCLLRAIFENHPFKVSRTNLKCFWWHYFFKASLCYLFSNSRFYLGGKSKKPKFSILWQ